MSSFFDRILSIIAYVLISNIIQERFFPGLIKGDIRLTALVFAIIALVIGWFFPLPTLWAGLLIAIIVGLGLYNYSNNF